MGTEITELDLSTCWQLLRSSAVGRLAFEDNGRLEVRPVNCAVDRGTVCFRTSKGGTVSRCAGQEVVFEVDGLESDGAAWSVLVRGVARVPREIEQIVETLDVPVFPWHPAPKPFFVLIEPSEVSGRRFHVADSNVWLTSLSHEPPSAPE